MLGVKRLRWLTSQWIQSIPALENLVAWVGSRTGLGEIWRKALPTPENYPKETFRRCQRLGIFWELDCSQWMDWSAYFIGPSPEDSYLFSLAKQGDTIIDAGGNIGLCALPLSKKAGASGRVYAFEPLGKNFQRLEKHVQINQIKNTKIIQAALSDSRGKVTMVQPSLGNNGAARIFCQGDEDIPSTEVDALRLDDWCAEENLNKLDLLKLDVEGHEPQILLGAEKTIQRFRPKIFLEAHETHLQTHGHSLKKLRQMLADMSYRTTDVYGDMMHILAEHADSD